MGGVERTFGTSGAKSVAAKVLCYNLAISTVDITGFHLVSLTTGVVTSTPDPPGIRPLGCSDSIYLLLP